MLITGITGFLGSYLYRSVEGRYDVFGTFCNSLSEQHMDRNNIRMDVTNKKSVIDCIEKTQPEIIIHTAGIRDINFCENYPEVALINHFEGTKNIIDAVRGSNTRIIYISSDNVYPGKKDFYNEGDAPSPVNNYGKAKLLAEEYIIRNQSNYIIVRASLLFGWTLKKQASNTVQDVAIQFESRKLNALTSVNYNTPLYVKSAVKILLNLLNVDYSGIVHLAGGDRLSRYELGVRTVEAFNLDQKLIVPSSTPLPNRPINSCLVMRTIPQLLGVPIPSLKDGLVAMKNDWKEAKWFNDEHTNAESSESI